MSHLTNHRLDLGHGVDCLVVNRNGVWPVLIGPMCVQNGDEQKVCADLAFRVLDAGQGDVLQRFSEGVLNILEALVEIQRIRLSSEPYGGSIEVGRGGSLPDASALAIGLEEDLSVEHLLLPQREGGSVDARLLTDHVVIRLLSRHRTPRLLYSLRPPTESVGAFDCPAARLTSPLMWRGILRGW